MVDISSQNNKINVTVSSSGNTANTNVTPDYAQYYSEKSKEWAISNRIVDNTDYSSKHYANESKKQADISTAKASEVVESGNNAVSNIESARDNAIIDITNQESLSVDNVNTAGITQVANVNSAGTTQINLTKEQVTLATNQANIATEQAILATNKTSEVVASGNTALSNITTAKNNAITTITKQETTSKNNVIATGNEQVERVNLTGIDNRTPIFSKSEIGTNEGVYKNVYDLKHSTFDKSKFTVVGNPMITDNGVASGFSRGNYLMTNTFTIDATKPWYFQCKFTTDTLGTSQGLIAFSQYFYLVLSSNKHLSFRTTNTNQKNWINTAVLSEKAEYTVDCGYDGTCLFLNLHLPNGQILNYNRNVASTYIGTILQSASIGEYDNFMFTGSIDLKQFSITVDGKEVFNGNKTGLDVINDVEIPYTLSKTGSKIVDVAYRDRVIDLYEQEGQAGYYTIDEENKNFTLPMGEIYGMIERKGTYHPPLLSTMWSDHLLNNMSWLRADTFSWQNGATYSQAYNELLAEYNNSASVEETEGSITFKRTPKGYKIALSTQETAIDTKYATNGIAWYYILDTTNKKFKLPRAKHPSLVTLTNSVPVYGNGMTLGITNGTTNYGLAPSSNAENNWAYRDNAYGTTLPRNHGRSGNTPGDGQALGITTDPTKSGIVADLSNNVKDYNMYLYFYVGAFTKSAEAQTAGLKAELFNGKADVDTPSIQAPYLKTTYVNGTSWYRIWSDGWCEQGGELGSGSSVVTFLKPFKDTNYIALISGADENYNIVYITSKRTTTSMTAVAKQSNGNSYTKSVKHWRVCGYIA